jgi:hypothetical protein
MNVENVTNVEELDGAASGLSAGLERKIEALLDAAFRELQHDTGETDSEYIYQRKVLKTEFRRILRSNA